MPNTISELNQYSNTSVSYNDNRAYAITFSANAASNTSVTIDQNETFVVSTGIDIVNVISQPGNITYTVNAASVGNVVASWLTLPPGVSNTSTGNGVYSITGVFDGVTWAAAKNLALSAPSNVGFNMPASISYPNPANVALTSTWNWNNIVTVASANTDGYLTLTNSLGTWPNEAAHVMYPSGWVANASVNGPANVGGVETSAAGYVKVFDADSAGNTYTLTFRQDTANTLPGRWYTTQGETKNLTNITTPGAGNALTITGNIEVINNRTFVSFVANNAANTMSDVPLKATLIKHIGNSNVTLFSNAAIGSIDIATTGYPAYSTAYSIYNSKNQSININGQGYEILTNSDYLGPQTLASGDTANITPYPFGMGKFEYSAGGGDTSSNQYQITFAVTGQGQLWDQAANTAIGNSITSSVFNGNVDSETIWGNVSPIWVANGWPVVNNTANSTLTITVTNSTANVKVLDAVPFVLSNVGTGTYY